MKIPPPHRLCMEVKCRLVLNVLVARVLRAFELERRMRDREMMARAFAQLVDNSVPAWPVGVFRHGHVRRDGHQVRRDGSDV